MINHQRTGRSSAAGLYPEVGTAGSQLEDQLTATRAHELRDPLGSILKPGAIQGVRHDLDKTVKVKVDRAARDVSAEKFDAASDCFERSGLWRIL
jgi:hypothetical protein